ncbi:hypothetical protein GCM10027059_38390 [Myceligenerans halotolerans]
MSENVAVLDRATADLFDLDVQETTVPYVMGSRASEGGCSGRECPSRGCSKTCKGRKDCK